MRRRAIRHESASSSLLTSVSVFDVWSVRRPFAPCSPACRSALLSAALQDLSNAVGSDRTVDLGIAVLSVGAFVGLTHYVGRGRGGVAFGVKLSVISWLFLQALVSSGLAVWTAIGMNGEPDWGLVVLAAAIAVVLFVPTVAALKRLDS